MSLNLQLYAKQTQQLTMTPQLQSSIKLLQFSRLEMIATIRRELELNPALEETSESATDEDAPPEEVEDASPDREVVIEEKIGDDIDWSNYVDEYNSTGIIETEKKESFNAEANIASGESLSESLLWQLSMAFPSDNDRSVGTYIIGNLNQEGYLKTTLPEIARATGVDPERIAYILSTMQTFDPAGICARDISECLRIQAENFNFKNAPVKKNFVINIIDNHLHNLKNRNIKLIQKKMGASVRKIVAALDIIKQLDPKPGLSFSHENPLYIIPDIFVYKSKGQFVIVLNDDGLPRLRINQFYRKALTGKKKIANAAKEYIRENLNSAAWFIKSVHQRRRTIRKVMESILKFQKDFFEHGPEKLKPLTLSDVAEDINMHQSTVSRATTNKYAHTSKGVLELKFFFNNSVKSNHGGDISSLSIQKKILRIIKEEDKKKPRTDSEIMDLLKNENISVARRTVAKYRDALKILPSLKRRQL